MANIFKSAAVEVLATSTNLYTCPGATQAVIHGFTVGNKDGVNDAVLTVEFFDGSNTFVLGDNIPVPVGGVVNWNSKINLEPGQQLNVIADGINKLVAYGAILEIS